MLNQKVGWAGLGGLVGGWAGSAALCRCTLRPSGQRRVGTKPRSRQNSGRGKRQEAKKEDTISVIHATCLCTYQRLVIFFFLLFCLRLLLPPHPNSRRTPSTKLAIATGNDSSYII
ncbi:predicted protein [Verticillium alfalfae VaMs.102]|uniref:Predicted protein n=1 Tax=Verticillium alfalfae (strain VaMs.102 / ATCC MYA-4576 / FGSC 10136) TaxID=526221 RepID=C9SJP0_VERA1|nr:predicted protein [Verticillium alfalfae VaMs.102]EEY19654.1 predicted protein [Verticillium alfalfae VaMs.102]